MSPGFRLGKVGCWIVLMAWLTVAAATIALLVVFV
jgi:hypothetical protein